MTLQPMIEARQLIRHLDDPSWVIADCRFDLASPSRGQEDYLQAHIPGAIYAHLERDLSGPPAGSNGRHPLPPAGILAGVFSRWGIGPGVRVVAYDAQDGSMAAARLWWCLRYLGHDAASVLDGGFAAWREMGGPVRDGEERRPPRPFQARPHPEMLVAAADVLAAIGTSETVLIDSRAPERYRGDEEPIDPVAGHIPGAINRPLRANADERGRMRPPDALRRDFERLLNGRPAAAAIVYCGSGVTACHNLLAMEHAGLHGARLYGGSWSEWCSDVSRPVATGGDPIE